MKALFRGGPWDGVSISIDRRHLARSVRVQMLTPRDHPGAVYRLVYDRDLVFGSEQFTYEFDAAGKNLPLEMSKW